MVRTEESERRFVEFLRHSVGKDALKPLTPDGERAVLEYGVRLAEHRNRLTTRFSVVSDLLREANWWAGRKAVNTSMHRLLRGLLRCVPTFINQPEEKIRESILSGDIILNLEGLSIGRANGLAVMDRGYYSFGIPVVVSARVAPGDGGVMNIEGLSGLSGEIFDKAVLILSGIFAVAMPVISRCQLPPVSVSNSRTPQSTEILPRLFNSAPFYLLSLVFRSGKTWR
jgi:predicted ATP-dependent protease